MNDYDFGRFNKKNQLYINGHPYAHGNISWFIKEFFMKRKESKFVIVHTYIICLLLTSCKKKYNFYIPSTTHQRKIALGLTL
jgi:hypothetical protein